ANLLQILVGQFQTVGQIVPDRVAAAEVASVNHVVRADDIDQSLAHSRLVQFNVEPEIAEVLEQRLLVVNHVEIFVRLREPTQLIRDVPAAVRDVNLQRRKPVEHAAADQIPETT